MPTKGLNQELLKQCIHRFRSLEVELIDAARSGLMAESDFKGRLKKVDHLRLKIEKLEVVANRPNKIDSREFSAATIKLPVLEACSKSEQNIVFATLQQNNELLGILKVDSEKLLESVKNANLGRVTWLNSIMKLSWMRTRLKWVANQLSNVRSTRSTLENFIKTLGPRNESNLSFHSDLISAFQELELKTNEIAKLRTRIQTENAINSDQEKWLREYSERRKSSISESNPPLPAELSRAKYEIESKISLGGQRACERLVVARNLVKSFEQSKDDERLRNKETESRGSNPTHKNKMRNQNKSEKTSRGKL